MDTTDLSIWSGFSGHGMGEWCRRSRDCSSSGCFSLDSLGICTNTDSYGVVEYIRQKNHGHSSCLGGDDASTLEEEEEEDVVHCRQHGQGDMVTASSGIMFIFQQSYPNISLEDQQEGEVGCMMDVSDMPGIRQTGPMSADEINVLSGLAEDQHDEYNVYPREGCASVDMRFLDDCCTAPAA